MGLFGALVTLILGGTAAVDSMNKGVQNSIKRDQARKEGKLFYQDGPNIRATDTGEICYFDYRPDGNRIVKVAKTGRVVADLYQEKLKESKRTGLYDGKKYYCRKFSWYKSGRENVKIELMTDRPYLKISKYEEKWFFNEPKSKYPGKIRICYIYPDSSSVFGYSYDWNNEKLIEGDDEYLY